MIVGKVESFGDVKAFKDIQPGEFFFSLSKKKPNLCIKKVKGKGDSNLILFPNKSDKFFEPTLVEDDYLGNGPFISITNPIIKTKELFCSNNMNGTYSPLNAGHIYQTQKIFMIAYKSGDHVFLINPIDGTDATKEILMAGFQSWEILIDGDENPIFQWPPIYPPSHSVRDNIQSKVAL